jgi:tetratricopeptide (TPR) repeat protein
MELMKPQVSLCMIVRNEESNLGECLKCVEGMFHEMIVVDTGSTDRTIAIAKSFGSRVVDFPWTEDFSAARNESRRQATGQWVFWLDADDRIDALNRQRLQVVFDGLHAYDAALNPLIMMSCVSRSADNSPDFAMSHARLFANASPIEWTGRVHESMICTTEGGVMTVHPTNVVIHHHGYCDPAETSRKQFRDLRLLERQYLINPDESSTLFYLARLHLAQGRPAEALRLARRSIVLDHEGRFLSTPKAHAVVVSSLIKLGRISDAVIAAEQASARFVDDASLLYQLGMVLLQAERLSEAEACLRRVLDIQMPEVSVAGAPIGLNGMTTRLMLGRVHIKQLRWREAEVELRRVLSEQPGCVDGWVLLGYLMLTLGRNGEMAELLRGLEQYPAGAMELAVLRAQLCIVEGRYDEGRRWLQTAFSSRPGAVEPWITLSDLLFQEGRDSQRCIAAHQKVLSIDPNHAAIQARLQRMLAEKRKQLVANEAFQAFVQTSVLGSASLSFGA